MEFYATKKKNEMSFAAKWMYLKNNIISEVRQAHKAKICMFSLIVDYRPNTNAAISWKTGHTEGRSHTRGGG
jgi:hypothetical protein